MITIKRIVFTLCIIGCISCSQQPKSQSVVQAPKESKKVPSFNPDSAYQYTVNQVAFGPRVPNTESHKECGNYLSEVLKTFGARVIEQEAVLYTYNSKALNTKNIIGSFLPDHANRILLCAHWDSRPFADQDPDTANHHTPIDGANDGAGACAILLEIARQISIQTPDVGVDIIFFDAEDWGAPEFDRHAEGGWCLGAEYWARHPHIPNYSARFGILLDMASGQNAQFYKERRSLYYAKEVVNKVWEAAQIVGYGSYFVSDIGGYIQDDHIPVNEIRKIPCIDIIQYDPNSGTGFAPYWHTLNDNINAVSKETMKAVGQTLMYVIYNQ